MIRRIALLRRVAITMGVLSTLVFAPATAFAAFSGNTQSHMTVSAAKLLAPSAAATKVNSSCGLGNWWGSANIMVSSYGNVPGANYYELKVLDPHGAVAFTGDLNSAVGKQYSFLNWSSNIRGTWTYEIRAYYKVPGSTNAWAGTALSGNIICL